MEDSLNISLCGWVYLQGAPYMKEWWFCNLHKLFHVVYNAVFLELMLFIYGNPRTTRNPGQFMPVLSITTNYSSSNLFHQLNRPSQNSFHKLYRRLCLFRCNNSPVYWSGDFPGNKFKCVLLGRAKRWLIYTRTTTIRVRHACPSPGRCAPSPAIAKSTYAFD